MPRRSRPPEGWPDPDWDLERVAISWTIRHLEAEDRIVANLRYPDHERRGKPVLDGERTPDATLLIDGRTAAIEVTGAWPHPRGVAAHRATSTARLIEVRLKAARPDTNVYVWGEFDIPAIMARSKLDEVHDVEDLTAAVLEIADRGPGRQMPIARDRLPGWLDYAHVTRSEAHPDLPTRTSASVILLARSDRPGHTADVLRFVVNDKARQVADADFGIVVLIPGWSRLADDLAEAMATRLDWPLWRLYWLDPGDVRLVWRRGDGRPSPTSGPSPRLRPGPA